MKQLKEKLNKEEFKNNHIKELFDMAIIERDELKTRCAALLFRIKAINEKYNING